MPSPHLRFTFAQSFEAPFLAIFTLSSYPQVTSYLEPTLSIHFMSNSNHYPYLSHTPTIVHKPSMTCLIFFWSYILININIVKPTHDSLYPLYFGLTHFTINILNFLGLLFLHNAIVVHVHSSYFKFDQYPSMIDLFLFIQSRPPIWDQSIFINLCLICHLPNILALTWIHDLPDQRSHFINFNCIVVFCLN